MTSSSRARRRRSSTWRSTGSTTSGRSRRWLERIWSLRNGSSARLRTSGSGRRRTHAAELKALAFKARMEGEMRGTYALSAEELLKYPGPPNRYELTATSHAADQHVGTNKQQPQHLDPKHMWDQGAGPKVVPDKQRDKGGPKAWGQRDKSPAAARAEKARAEQKERERKERSERRRSRDAKARVQARIERDRSRSKSRERGGGGGRRGRAGEGPASGVMG